MHGLALLRMHFDAWAFSRMVLHFPRMDWLSRMLSHAWAFFTYGSTSSCMDWLSHVCFLTHGLFHVWVYFVTHGLALSRMFSHASLEIIFDLPFGFPINNIISLMHEPFSRMGLLFPRMD